MYQNKTLVAFWRSPMRLAQAAYLGHNWKPFIIYSSHANYISNDMCRLYTTADAACATLSTQAAHQVLQYKRGTSIEIMGLGWRRRQKEVRK